MYGYTDPVGELVEQRVYTPFGQVLNADKAPLAKPSGLYFDFRLRVGMHGMFAERLDAGTTDPLLRHADARVVYLTPNRTYDPQTGLWWQRDPNATGLLSLRSYGWGGDGIGQSPGSFRADAHYADGLNLYGAFGSSPVMRTDPNGLTALLSPTLGLGLGLDLEAAGASAAAAAQASIFGVLYNSAYFATIGGSLAYFSGLDAIIYGEGSDFLDDILNDLISINSSEGTPRQAQQKVNKGQAPKDIDRIDPPEESVKGSQWHAHDKQGRSVNQDGTIHDQAKGAPQFGKKAREFLRNHGWNL